MPSRRLIFQFENMPISCLHGIDRNAIGTFSKVLFPSLPLGYLVIPSELVERFRAVRVAMDISPAIFSQAGLADFIREGSLQGTFEECAYFTGNNGTRWLTICVVRLGLCWKLRENRRGCTFVSS